MNVKSGLRIAVVGASSLIGEAVIDELRARKVPFAELHMLDDERNLGRSMTDTGGAEAQEASAAKTPAVGDVAAFDFSRVDLAFFCGRAALSERYAEAAAEHAWVIDGSAVFRTRGDVPLVAADINRTGAGGRGRARIDRAARKRQRRAGHGARAAACPRGPRAGRCGHLSGGVGQRQRGHG